MSKSKVNVTSGFHDLVLIQYKVKEGKAHFFFKPIHHECNLVQRTFTQGSDSLRGFLRKLTGKEQVIATDSNCKPLIGRFIRAEIIQSKKKPQFMDLNRVVQILNLPEDICPCNKGVLSVNDREIVGGGHDA